MDIFQLATLLFYLLVVISVFFVTNSKLLDYGQKFFSYLLTALLILSIGGLVTGVFGPQFFGWQTVNIVIPSITATFLVSLVVALVKFKIFDATFIFYKIVSFASLLIILGTSFAALIFLSDFLLIRFTQFRQVVIGAILAIIAIFAFQPVRIFLEKILGQVFFQDIANLEKLEVETDLLLAQNLKISKLCHNWLAKLIQFTKLTGAAIVIFENEKPAFTKFANLPRLKTAQYTKFSKLEKIVNAPNQNYAYIIPLIFRDKNCGILILGNKANDAFFANEIARLAKITRKLTAPLIQALAFDKIDQFNQKLALVVEKSTHELAVANLKLSQIDKMKDEFVSLTSHELRTPMTAIKSYLWMVLSGRAGKISGKLARYLDLAYTSTERMIKLVNDLLNVSKIESGKIEFHPQGVNIVGLAKTVMRDVEAEADRRGQTLMLEQKDLPLVFADWNRIHEVLTNLVGNSLKFTPRGGKIKISFAQVDDFVEISVQDTGKGISEADMPRLFHKFGLVGGSLTATRETGGSGLGLYICKSLMDLHKGKIWAKSKLGAGSTFTFSLPTATDAQLARFGIYDPEAKIRQVTGSLPGTAIPA